VPPGTFLSAKSGAWRISDIDWQDSGSQPVL
jgi:hypothetical protein